MKQKTVNDSDTLGNAHTKALERTIAKLEVRIRKYNEDIKNLRQQLIHKDHTINNYFNVLNSIYHSRTWKLFKLYSKLIKRREVNDDIGGGGSGRNASTQGYTHEDVERAYYATITLPYTPLISILMPVYNVNPIFLEKAIASVQAQAYLNWELCIVDDGSTNQDTLAKLKELEGSSEKIHIKFRKKNGGISKASNDALHMSKGEFIALMDNDDEITYHALLENVKALNTNKDIDFLYSDEDKIDIHGESKDTFHKPDFDPYWLWSTMYTGHLGVYRKSLVEKVGGFRSEYDGAQDWDLALRVSAQTDNIYHIPAVLYHWREVPGSAALTTSAKPWAYKAGLRTIENFFAIEKRKATITATRIPGIFHYHLQVKGNPKISIIIPTKDQYDVLQACLASIEKYTKYNNYEIILIDHESKDTKLLEYFKTTPHHVMSYKGEFNFSAMNNKAVQQAKGEYILFLNNDMEVISPYWLDEMLSLAQLPNTGAVGAKLFYPDKTIQHTGIRMYFRGPVHIQTNRDFTEAGEFGNLMVNRTQLAVTGACLFIAKKKFQQAGGFSLQFPIEYNDIDLCLTLHSKGYRNVLASHAFLHHHESLTRGSGQEDIQKWYEFSIKWREYFGNDPYNNYVD